jgi:integrase
MNVDTSIDPRAGSVTLREYSGTWLRARPALKPRTVEQYRHLLNRHILPELGSMTLAKLTPALVRSWHSALAAKRSTTAAAAYRLLSAMCHTAVADEVILRTPCRIVGAGVERSPERPTVSLSELDALAAEMPEHLQLLVKIAGWCALRRGEPFGLQRGDIDITRPDNCCTSSGSHVERLHAGRSSKIIRWHSDSSLSTHPHQRGREPSKKLRRSGERLVAFLWCKGWPTSSQGAKSGMVGGTQQARPTRTATTRLETHRTTWAARTGATTKELMTRLGHASPAAALKYQHAEEDRDASIATALAKMATSHDDVATTTDGVAHESRTG